VDPQPSHEDAPIAGMTMKKRGFVVAALLVVLFIASRCYPAEPVDPIFAKDPASTAAEVLKVVPVGSTLDFAKSTMESKRFQCVMRYDQTYPVIDPEDGARRIESPPADFLWCPSDRATGFAITTTWQVFLVITNGAVASVVADKFTNGL
jgi:hypothetical protein